MSSQPPDPTAGNQHLDEVITAYLKAVEAGTAPDQEAWLARYPELASDLAAFFVGQNQVEKLVAPLQQALAPDTALHEAPTLSPSPTPSAMPLTKIRYFGDYELLDEIAHGGMGVVYRARQVSLNRIVALKMILAGQLASPEDVARFHREAEAAANLDHPNIVPIYEVGEHEGQHYFSMKLVEGGSLAERVASGEGRGASKEDQKKAAELVATIARAVHHAHQRGILHRDLKPANILMDGQGRPNVTDFGLARRVEGDPGHTRIGSILGTPSYMPPEQARSEKVLTTGVDIYSLGAILYELLTGRPPFRAETPLDTIMQVLDSEPQHPRLLNPRIDPDLETICLKCLEKEPAKRFGSAEALAEDLERWSRGEPIEARRSNLAERCVKWVRRRPTIAALSAACFVVLIVGMSGVFYQWYQTQRAWQAEKTARGDADEKGQLAIARAEELTRQHQQLQEELHQSNLLRSDLLVRSNDFSQAEALLWRSYLARPDTRDRRAWWRLWNLYRERPRRSAWLTDAREGAFLRKVVFSPDGRRLAIVRGGIVSIHDALTGREQATLRISPAMAVDLAFAPDNSRLAVAHLEGGIVTLWAISGPPEKLFELRSDTQPEFPVLTQLAIQQEIGRTHESVEAVKARFRPLLHLNPAVQFFGPDRLMTVDNAEAVVWDISRQAVVGRFMWKGLQIARSFKLNALAGHDQVLLNSFYELELWTVPQSTGQAFVRKDLRLATPGTLTLIDPPAVSLMGSLDPRGNRPKDVLSGWNSVVSPDGHWLATQQKDKISLWDLQQLTKRTEVQAEGELTLFFPPGQAVLSGVAKDRIYTWLLPNLRLEGVVRRIGGEVLAISAPPASRDLIVVEAPCVATYERTPTQVVTPLAVPKVIPALGLAAQGPAVVGMLSRLDIWTAGEKGVPQMRIVEMPSGLINPTMVRDLLVLPGRSLAVTAEAGGLTSPPAIAFIDLVTGERRGGIPLQHGELKARYPGGGSGSLVSSLDESMLAVRTREGVFIVRVDERKIERAQPGNVWSVDFSSDGRQFVYVQKVPSPATAEANLTYGQAMFVVDTETGRKLAETTEDVGNDARFAPKGTLIASGTEGGIVLRDAKNLRIVARLVGSGGKPVCLAFAPDGRTIATGEQDGKLRLWDLERREEMAILTLGDEPVSHVVFTPDGKRIRYKCAKQVAEIDLMAFEPHIEGNRARHVKLLEAERSGRQVPDER
jgi:WD40 repeat protein